MDILYQNPSGFHEITSGSSDGDPPYAAGPGYNYVTGLGSPIANLVVGALDGTSSPIPPPPPPPPPAPPPAPDKLVLTAPTTETAGTPFSLTVTAENSSGATDTGFSGTIDFTSTDAQASLPQSVNITAADDGSVTISVTLKTAGSQSITATDPATPATTGTLFGISVSPAPASQFILSGLPTNATVGLTQSLTVTAEDPYGNLATRYAGTVQFSSSDPAASLPGSYTFGSNNQGVASFSITFGTPGTQSVTVTSTTGITATDSGITVAPAAPTNLAATQSPRLRSISPGAARAAQPATWSRKA